MHPWLRIRICLNCCVCITPSAYRNWLWDKMNECRFLNLGYDLLCMLEGIGHRWYAWWSISGQYASAHRVLVYAWDLLFIGKLIYIYNPCVRKHTCTYVIWYPTLIGTVIFVIQTADKNCWWSTLLSSIIRLHTKCCYVARILVIFALICVADLRCYEQCLLKTIAIMKCQQFWTLSIIRKHGENLSKEIGFGICQTKLTVDVCDDLAIFG